MPHHFKEKGFDPKARTAHSPFFFQTLEIENSETAMNIEQRLERIEALLIALRSRQSVREWYSVEEFAGIVGRSVLTCRCWCRTGRIQARKKESGRGAHTAWAISHEELQRYQKEGLLRGQ